MGRPTRQDLSWPLPLPHETSSKTFISPGFSPPGGPHKLFLIPPGRLPINDLQCSRRAYRIFYWSRSHKLRVQSQKPLDWAKKTRICSCCLTSTSSFWQSCPFKRACGTQGCKGDHQKLLHYTAKPDRKTPPPKKPQEVVVNTNMHRSETITLYKIDPVLIRNGWGEMVQEFASRWRLE